MVPTRWAQLFPPLEAQLSPTSEAPSPRAVALRTSQTRGRARFSGRRWKRGTGNAAERRPGDLRGARVHFPVAEKAHHGRKGSVPRGSGRDGRVQLLGRSTARPASPGCAGQCSRGSSHAHLRTGLPGSVHVPEKLREEVPQSREGLGRACGAQRCYFHGEGVPGRPVGSGRSQHTLCSRAEGRPGGARQAGQAAILGAYETAGVPTVPPRRPELQPSVPIRGREAAPQKRVFSPPVRGGCPHVSFLWCVLTCPCCRPAAHGSQQFEFTAVPHESSWPVPALGPEPWDLATDTWHVLAGLRRVPSWWRCLSSLGSRQVASGPPEPAVLLAVSGPLGPCLRSWWPSTPSVCFLTVGPSQAPRPRVLEAFPRWDGGAAGHPGVRAPAHGGRPLQCKGAAPSSHSGEYTASQGLESFSRNTLVCGLGQTRASGVDGSAPAPSADAGEGRGAVLGLSSTLLTCLHRSCVGVTVQSDWKSLPT